MSAPEIMPDLITLTNGPRGGLMLSDRASDFPKVQFIRTDIHEAEITALKAEIERLKGVLANIRKGEVDAWEKYLEPLAKKYVEWGERFGLNPNQHPLHYIYTDIKTQAARDAWREAVKYIEGKAQAAIEGNDG